MPSPTDWTTLTIAGAAVMQAVATVVALYIGVWTPLRAEKVIHRRERLQARCIATAIYPDLLQMQARLEGIRNRTEGQPLPEEDKPSVQVAQFVESLAVEIPPMLNRNVDQLYLLGEDAGPTLLQLLSVALQYNSMIETATHGMFQQPTANANDHVRILSGHLHVMEELIAQGSRYIRALHDGNKAIGDGVGGSESAVS